jgi:glutathione S-transferase
MSVSLITQTYVACTSVLYLKFLRVTMIQARWTFSTGSRPPEDKSLPLARGKPKQNYGLSADLTDEKILKAREMERRWRQIVQNDLENIPLALLVFGAGVLVQDRVNTAVQVGAMVAFTALRVGHTFAYAMKLQPYRAWCWRFGVVAILVGAVNSVIAVYQ